MDLHNKKKIGIKRNMIVKKDRLLRIKNPIGFHKCDKQIKR